MQLSHSLCLNLQCLEFHEDFIACVHLLYDYVIYLHAIQNKNKGLNYSSVSKFAFIAMSSTNKVDQVP